LEWSFIARTIFTFCCEKFSDAVIYVADNASTDTSIAYVKTHFHPLVSENKGNLALQQFNEALKQVDAELYALVNSDIEVTEIGCNRITTFKRTSYNSA
jgi:GT2 family glycosyltransferase